MARALIHPLPLILATSSLSRQELLSRTGLKFESIDPKLDEKSITATNPETQVIKLAKAKVEAAVAAKQDYGLYLGADTVVIHNAKILSKPKYKMTAVEMLKKLSNSVHVILTGWALFNSYKETWDTRHSNTLLTFRKLTAKEIEDYVNDNPVTTWAGGYNWLTSSAISFITKIDGSLTGANGLPLEQILPVLNRHWSHPYKPSHSNLGG